MTRITVRLSQNEREALRLAAGYNLRGLRGQAEYLIIKGLATEATQSSKAALRRRSNLPRVTSRQHPTKPTNTQPIINRPPSPVVRSTSYSFSGPLPPPEILDKYGQIIPDGADRILRLVEQQQTHRQLLEKAVTESDVRSSDHGLWLGFAIVIVCVIGGFALIAIGKDASGLAAILVPLGSLAAIFIHARRSRRKGRKKD